MRVRRGNGEDGFTLIELMVVVLVIGALVAIAVPTFLKSHDNAKGRAAQSNARSALSAVKTFHAENEAYWLTSDAHTRTLLQAAEPSLGWGAAMGNPSGTPEEVSWSSTATTIVIAVRSKTGDCFYIRDDADLDSATAGTWFGKTVGVACDADGAGPVWKKTAAEGWPPVGESA